MNLELGLLQQDLRREQDHHKHPDMWQLQTHNIVFSTQCSNPSQRKILFIF